MAVEYTLTVTRWMWLRLLPGAWVRVCRRLGVPLWHPKALVLLLRGFVLLAKSGG